MQKVGTGSSLDPEKSEWEYLDRHMYSRVLVAAMNQQHANTYKFKEAEVVDYVLDLGNSKLRPVRPIIQERALRAFEVDYIVESYQELLHFVTIWSHGRFDTLAHLTLQWEYESLEENWAYGWTVMGKNISMQVNLALFQDYEGRVSELRTRSLVVKSDDIQQFQMDFINFTAIKSGPEIGSVSCRVRAVLQQDCDWRNSTMISY